VGDDQAGRPHLQDLVRCLDLDRHVSAGRRAR
jgi:hypothetical protein